MDVIKRYWELFDGYVKKDDNIFDTRSKVLEKLQVEIKQEVFDDIENSAVFGYGRSVPVIKQIFEEIKLRHLSKTQVDSKKNLSPNK